VIWCWSVEKYGHQSLKTAEIRIRTPLKSANYFCFAWQIIGVDALWNRAGHYIFALWFLSIFYLFYFLASSQRPQIGCLPYFRTWCGLSANLKCTCEMCSTWLAATTGRKKSPFWHHRTTLLGYIFGTKTRIDNRKKLLNMVSFRLLMAEICWRVWGTPANFNRFRILAALLHGTLVVGVSHLCGVVQRAPPIFGRVAITLGIGPHF